ncbi:MAG: clostripain-related cysteine peptidase, partial [Campylobacterota bacterium]|nr:clostripain-related cysteine peptidase [Campylobacterota bacterium]
DIRDSNDNNLWEDTQWVWDDTANLKQKVIFTPTENTDYFVAVGNWETGTYSVDIKSATVVADDHVNKVADFNASSGTTFTNQTASETATFETEFDKDIFKLQATAGTSYEITLTSGDDIWPWMDVVDSNDEYLWDSMDWQWDQTANLKQKIIFTPEEAGDYFIKLNTNETGDYTLKVNTIDLTDDHANSIAEIATDGTDTLTIGAKIDASLETSADKDYYMFTVAADKKYTITLDSTASDFWPFVDVISGTDEWGNDNYNWQDVQWQWDDNSKVKLTFTPQTAGNYYLKIDGGSAGDYSIKIEDAGSTIISGDDHTNSVTGDFYTANNLGAGEYDNTFAHSDVNSGKEIITGNIDTNEDKDIFKLKDAKANQAYEITLSADNTWPYLDVLDKDGNYLWNNVDWIYSEDSSVKTKVIFTPTTDGNYFFKVSGWEIGEYSVAVEAITIAADDHANNIKDVTGADTYENLDASGVEKTGKIDTTHDKDFFKLTAVKDGVYTITLSSADIWPYVEVQDKDGNYLWENISWEWDDSADVKTKLVFKAPEARDYYLKVGGWETGDYSLKVSKETVVEDLVADSASETEAIVKTDGTVTIGTLDTTYDKDVYKFSVVSGKSYEITLNSDDTNPYLNIIDGDENFVWDGVEWQWDENVDNKIIFTPTASKDFYLKVDGWETGEYDLRVKELTDDHANSIADVTDVSTFNMTSDTQVIKGSFETSADVDYFKLVATENSSYQITLSSDDDIWPYLDVMDASGNYLWNDIECQWDDSDSVKQKLTFSVTTVGDYYLKVDGWDTGDYRVEIEKLVIEVDDHTDSVDGDFYTTTADGNNDNTFTGLSNATDTETIIGKLGESSDKDFFKLAGEAGKSYTVTLTTTDSTWPYLDILDAEGNYLWDEINWEWDENSTAKVIINASTTKDYFIKVDGWEVSDYSLTVTNTTVADDFTNSVEGPWSGNVFSSIGEAGTTITGELETTYDKDVFKLDLVADETYEVNLSAGNSKWPYMELLDENGEYIWENIDSFWNEDSDGDATTNITDSFIFTASETKGYFLKVDNWEATTYSVDVKKLSDTDDHGDDIANATTLTVGAAAITADLETVKDLDYFEVAVASSKTYEILLNTTDGSWPNIDVVNANGDFLWNNVSWGEWDNDGDATNENILYFTADSTELIYLKVDSWQAVEDYTLQVNKLVVVADDYDNTVDDAKDNDAVLVDGTSIEGDLETTYDKDIFKLSATAGKSYEITLATDGDTWPYVNILDENGDSVNWEDIDWQWDDTLASKITFNPTETKDYFIMVDGWEVTDYDLRVKDTSLVADDFSADITTTGIVVVDDATGTNGKLEVLNDIDWIKVTLDNSKIYNLSIDADFEVIIDGVYDAQGNYIEGTYYDSAEDRFQTDTTRGSDTTTDYYIAIAGHSTGSYNIKVNEFVPEVTDKEADSISTTASVSVNNVYDGSVDYAYDEDWIKIRLEKNTNYCIDLKGDSLDDTVINGIYNENGILLADTFNDDANDYTLDSKVSFIASSSGDYYISVGGFDTDEGSYKLTTTIITEAETVEVDASESDINDTISTAIAPNAVGSYESGIIDYAGDTDMYEYEFQAGQTYDIALFGSQTDHGTLNDTYLDGLYDASGNLIAGTTDDDGGIGTNSLIRYTAEEDAKYYVKAAAVDDMVGSYEVKVSKVDTTEAEVQQASTGFTEGDGSWTIMVYIAADNNLEGMGIDDINEMEAIDLPDNVNVTFLFDRTDGYSTAEGDWTGTKQGVISHDNDMYSIGSAMEDIGEQNTGDGQTLTNFIDWSTQTAVADNYALVVWNHGGGISGVAWDETSGYDNLGLNEMTTAVQNSSVDKFEMIGFDACLQGVVDQSYAVKDVADIVVSSEDNEPGDGWDYEGWFEKIANDADGTVTADELVTYVVDSYGEFYQNYSYTTQSAVHTNQLDALNSAFKDFNDTLSSMTSAENNQFKSDIKDVQTFGAYDEYMDLGDLAKIVDDIYDDSITDNAMQNAAQSLFTAVDTAVFAEVSNDDDPTGISIYYPGFDDQNYIDEFQIAQETNISKLYDVLTA